jgi:hypothetical protein
MDDLRELIAEAILGVGKPPLTAVALRQADRVIAKLFASGYSIMRPVTAAEEAANNW